MLQLTSHQTKALQVTQVKNLQSKIEETAARKFAASVALSDCIRKGYNWLKSEEGKQFLKDKKVGMDQLILEVYGFQKSFYYKLLKLGQLAFERPEILERFTASVNEAKESNLGASLSIENALNFAKEVKGIEAGKGSEGSEGSEPKVTKDKPILVLTFDGRPIGINSVSMRINSDGTLKTSADKKDLRAVVDYLGQYLGMKPAKVEPAKVEPAKPTKKASKRAQVLNAADMAFRTEIVDLSEHA